jgi:hypothetical protein
MIRLKACMAVLAFLVASLTIPSAANAQATRTWVSGVGDDVNPCSRTAPCKTFAGAISKTAAGGEISVLDPGGFGAVTITKSITINGGGIEGSVLNSSVNGFIINGAGVDVVLRNLDVDGSGAVGGTNGIRFIQGDSLLVENTTIRDNTGGANPAGISFESSGSAQLFVRNVAISGNGNVNGATGGGIVVKPGAAGNARVTLERVFVSRNAFGIAFDGTASTAGINATIIDSVSAGNSQDGILAVTSGGGAPIGVMVKNTQSVNNAIGIRSIGAGVTIRVDGSAVIGNSTGLSPSGGALLSFGNNNVEANGANGAFSGSVALK